jgi:hypothetical protein
MEVRAGSRATVASQIARYRPLIGIAIAVPRHQAAGTGGNIAGANPRPFPARFIIRIKWLKYDNRAPRVGIQFIARPAGLVGSTSYGDRSRTSSSARPATELDAHAPPRDLPLARRQPDRYPPLVINAHRGWSQHVAQAVGNELCPAIAPDSHGAVGRPQVDAKDHRVPRCHCPSREI